MIIVKTLFDFSLIIYNMMKGIRLILIAIASLYFLYYINTYTEWHFLDYVNLIFHEAGHTIFSPFGMFFKIEAGSGMQVAIPLFISIYFFYTQQIISGSICLMWVGQNLLNISIYVKDAIDMKLDLLGGDYVIHDWNYILTEIGVLQYAPQIASVFYVLGVTTIFFAIISAIIYWIKNDDVKVENNIA